MTAREGGRVEKIALTKSQQNIYHGVLQDGQPTLYLVARSYRFRPLAVSVLLAALKATIVRNPIQLCVLRASETAGEYPDLVPRLSAEDII